MAFITKVIFDPDFESTVFYLLCGKRPLVKQEGDDSRINVMNASA